MRRYLANIYVPGTYIRSCDICGLRYLRSEMKKNWAGLVVCDKDWEPMPEYLRKRRPTREKPFKRD